MLEQNILMILKLLLNSQIIWMIFITTWINTIGNKKLNISMGFDDMVTDMLGNEKRNPIVTELFIRGRKLNISLFLLHNFILFCQEYYTKLYALFYHENSK